MTITELLRASLAKRTPSDTGRFSKSQALASYNEFFAPGGVLDRMVVHAKSRKLMGAFRYEQPVSGLSYEDQARRGLAKTYMERAREKIALYEETGNMEFLVDLFNYALLEFSRPYHPNAHFESTERKDP